MDLSRFYDAIRSKLKLTNANVRGFDFLISYGLNSEVPRNHLAYILATTWHETAFTMQPIREYGDTKYFTKMYDINGSRPEKAKELGNLAPGDGAKYCGRGYVQLTGKSNYAKASKLLGIDFVTHPEKVMEPEYASQILFAGMEFGWFTGKKLDDFIDTIDESDVEDGREFEGGRRIINGTDKAKGISNYALRFEAALKAAGYDGKPVGELIESPIAKILPKEDIVSDSAFEEEISKLDASGFITFLAKLINIFLGKSVTT
ncbi:glycoside hydrolase family 19 protein [Phyllobacterium sophorae]|uniref:Glycoside hydrolase family 19 catalytic domain-containing protein n=1 Tax=Phyllobacterium sophorae TaxID=1520277 RepID=A0A2P7BE04_9HYPH|nr:glycoside hydrolase family 19 protein [Phyllobacterium sophorae]PSH64649.1 hypothetical protein CU103_12250 [Phyllobacterium sophorae]